VKYFRSKNGLEYRDVEFLEFYKTKGIIRHFWIKGTPQQNEIVERMNITLCGKGKMQEVKSKIAKTILGLRR
jgi:transposase InsO family protein